MKKIITLLFVLQSVSSSQNLFRGDIVISSLFSECIDTTYILNPLSGSIPSNSEYQTNKLVYEIILTITLYGNDFAYTSPLALTFNTPDNNSITHIINQELIEFWVNESYEFVIYLQTREKGWTNIEINQWDMHHLEIVNNMYVNFINYSFYLE